MTTVTGPPKKKPDLHRDGRNQTHPQYDGLIQAHPLVVIGKPGRDVKAASLALLPQPAD